MRKTKLGAVHIGTAGWQLPKELATGVSGASQLERYARLFNCVEINTTFYRPHMQNTFERWASSVPNDFRFAVKVSKVVTHEQRLTRVKELKEFVQMVSALGDRLGPLLIQLPPSLAFSLQAGEVLLALREFHDGAVVLEPRHSSWKGKEPEALLNEARIGRVAADPPMLSDHLEAGGYEGTVYFRLHGSPRMYWSSYDEVFLHRVRDRMRMAAKNASDVWVIFDNTAAGAAVPNAMRLRALLG